MAENTNQLALRPARSEQFRWEKDAEGAVTLFIENKGLFNRIAQKLFRKPKVSQVHLDGTGSFLWPLLDGSLTVRELGEELRQRFGEAAEPLYPRLLKYLSMLKRCGFITVQ